MWAVVPPGLRNASSFQLPASSGVLARRGKATLPDVETSQSRGRVAPAVLDLDRNGEAPPVRGSGMGCVAPRHGGVERLMHAPRSQPSHLEWRRRASIGTLDSILVQVHQDRNGHCLLLPLLLLRLLPLMTAHTSSDDYELRSRNAGPASDVSPSDSRTTRRAASPKNRLTATRGALAATPSVHP